MSLTIQEEKINFAKKVLKKLASKYVSFDYDLADIDKEIEKMAKEEDEY